MAVYPTGLGNWQAAVAAVMGLVAKENVVGTFGILYGFAEVAEDGVEIWGYFGGQLYGHCRVFLPLCLICFVHRALPQLAQSSAK